LGDIMALGTAHDERERDATRVDQQMTLAPIFFPDMMALPGRTYDLYGIGW
jgi:hypothetical protein